MKKILLLIPALNAGGAERVMVTLANEWSKTEEVSLIVFNDGKCFYNLDQSVQLLPMQLMPPQNKILRMLSIPIIEIKRFVRIFKEIHQGNYDFTLSFCYTTNIFVTVVAMFLKKEKIFISERNDPYEYPIWLRMIINKFYNHSSMIICQNQVVEEYFYNQKFKNSLCVLPNPVNFNDIPYGRPENVMKEFVNVGRLIEQKNHRLLIEAFYEVNMQYPDWILRIYGIGPLETELKNLINLRGIQDKVHLMGVIPKVMFKVNESSIFVLSSNFEGFPNVLIEAMATGLPVVSTNFKTGIAAELIKTENNGYLVSVGNKAELIMAMKNMIARFEDFDEMGRNNKEIASAYKDSIVAEKWLMKLKGF